ncbi:MAG: hypothetical protein CBC38_07160 [Gammaproteobacteria bacterium TMED78]|nr:MAG: hypothetical protein CBC38_07160 [Gammaproteobacteria bacterium TMED78]|tara:strand:+ start:12201 stop:12824 length:624 start_codon:yes stop_codon:yes gene_type:complete
MANNHWRKSQSQDPFVNSAHQESFRSRSHFKLKEIDKKYNIIKKNINCIDLGSFPGGWSLYANKVIGNTGKVFSIDIKEMVSIPGVTFIQGDFSDNQVCQKLASQVNNLPINLVMSDIAPNITGNSLVDQSRSIYLAEQALKFSTFFLEYGGVFLVKLFQGDGFENYINGINEFFGKIKIIKPKASRKESREVFLLAKSFNFVRSDK